MPARAGSAGRSRWAFRSQAGGSRPGGDDGGHEPRADRRRAGSRSREQQGEIGSGWLPASWPARLSSTRRALTPFELDQINAAARTSGKEVILDALLLRLHTESACRRGGALALRLGDLDTDHCLVWLEEKGSTIRWQPVSRPLAARLADHAACCGATQPADPLLRYPDRRALTPAATITSGPASATSSPGVAAHGITTHWLRHTTLTWVERHFGYGIARAYAGHTDTTGPATTTYIKADLEAVATALAAMTGHPHPLGRL